MFSNQSADAWGTRILLKQLHGILQPHLSKVCVRVQGYMLQSGVFVAMECARVKPILNWANVCLPEHTSDTSTNYDSFLN